MSFDEYVENEITKPVSDWYDPDGNSSRAVVVRMKKKGILVAIGWETHQIISDLRYSITNDVNGLDTTIGCIIQFIILPVLLPFSPFIRTYTRYKSAINDYKREYKNKY